MTEYVVRLAARADLPALTRNRVRMFEDMAVLAGAPFDPAYLARLEAETLPVFEAGFGTEQFGWLAEHDGTAVASAMVAIQPWLPHPRYPEGVRPYLHSVYSDPGHRGNGLALRLTEAAMAWAKERRYSTMVLHASEQGRPIYEKLGFVSGSEYFRSLA